MTDSQKQFKAFRLYPCKSSILLVDWDVCCLPLRLVFSVSTCECQPIPIILFHARAPRPSQPRCASTSARNLARTDSHARELPWTPPQRDRARASSRTNARTVKRGACALAHVRARARARARAFERVHEVAGWRSPLRAHVCARTGSRARAGLDAPGRARLPVPSPPRCAGPLARSRARIWLPPVGARARVRAGTGSTVEKKKTPGVLFFRRIFGKYAVLVLRPENGRDFRTAKRKQSLWVAVFRAQKLDRKPAPGTSRRIFWHAPRTFFRPHRVLGRRSSCLRLGAPPVIPVCLRRGPSITVHWVVLSGRFSVYAW